MRARRAAFVTSATSRSGFPPVAGPEIAFAGRSNVGKSTLINRLVGQNKLAKTSKTPGRTRLINWFEVVSPENLELAFVDLPGYGYAKVSRELRFSWQPLVESYLRDDRTLAGVLVLVDSRRAPAEEEQSLVAWLRAADIPARVVVTKSDKISKAKRRPAQAEIQRSIGVKAPPVLVSASTGLGIEALWKTIHELIRRA